MANLESPESWSKVMMTTLSWIASQYGNFGDFMTFQTSNFDKIKFG